MRRAGRFPHPDGGSDHREVTLPTRAGTCVRNVRGVDPGAWFLWAMGGRTILSPTRLEPVLVDDWSTHVLGWLFLRNERFAIPLGKLTGLVYPVGTTVGYTDSIPWAALMLRPFSSVLPID